MVVGKKFEITPVSEFYNIAKDEGVFFWNFIIDNQTKTPVSLDPLINEEPSSPRGHQLRSLVNDYGIRMYESYTKHSIDFLMGFGFKSDDIWYNKKKRFKPLFLAFNGLRYVRGIPSNEVTCYCLNGVVETIILTDPTLLPLY
jgi:hypothetical protein